MLSEEGTTFLFKHTFSMKVCPIDRPSHRHVYLFIYFLKEDVPKMKLMLGNMSRACPKNTKQSPLMLPQNRS